MSNVGTNFKVSDLKINMGIATYAYIRQVAAQTIDRSKQCFCTYAWYLLQGSPQSVQLEFPHDVQIQELRIQFQGGFAGKTCWIEGTCSADSMQKICDFYPEDVNRLQVSFCFRVIFFFQNVRKKLYMTRVI